MGNRLKRKMRRPNKRINLFDGCYHAIEQRWLGGKLTQLWIDGRLMKKPTRGFYVTSLEIRP